MNISKKFIGKIVIVVAIIGLGLAVWVALASRGVVKPIALLPVRVKLIDAFTAEPIANTDVKLYSDNGILCIAAGCDTEGQEWGGHSDNSGLVVVPAKYMNKVVHVTATGYSKSGGSLSSSKKEWGVWHVELEPDTKIDNGERLVKLLDRENGKPLKDLFVRVSIQEDCYSPVGGSILFTGKTNALGNMYYPVSIYREGLWVCADGYKSRMTNPHGTLRLDRVPAANLNDFKRM